MIKTLTSLVLMAVGFAAAASPEQAWRAAPVYLPGELFTKSVSTAQPAKGTPLVIYLHGCAGIDPNHDRSWARFLASNGYAVIMPDSMARTGRRSVCDPLTHTRDISRFPKVREYRHQELAYALQQAEQLPWVDPDRIFLMGHSEGAFAASQFGDPGFRAIVISAWTCGSRDGLSTRIGVPVLNLVFDRDPWYWNTVRQGRCSDHRAQGVVTVAEDKAQHDTFSSPAMRQAVLEFFGR